MIAARYNSDSDNNNSKASDDSSKQWADKHKAQSSRGKDRVRATRVQYVLGREEAHQAEG